MRKVFWPWKYQRYFCIGRTSDPSSPRPPERIWKRLRFNRAITVLVYFFPLVRKTTNRPETESWATLVAADPLTLVWPLIEKARSFIFICDLSLSFVDVPWGKERVLCIGFLPVCVALTQFPRCLRRLPLRQQVPSPLGVDWNPSFPLLSSSFSFAFCSSTKIRTNRNH